MTGIDVVTLVAIGLVLVVVSLPRLRVLARADNQSDAFEIALSLHRALVEHPDVAPRLASGASLDLLVATSPVLKKHLGDVELLEGGRRLRCHGYLFDVVPAEESAGRAQAGPPEAGGKLSGEAARLVVRAWPWHQEHTGRAAYLVTPAGEILEHANHDGRFGGAQGAPSAADLTAPTLSRGEAGWRTVRSERPASAL